MKKTYGRRRKRLSHQQVNQNNIPQWAKAFLSEQCDYASSSILSEIGKLDYGQQTALGTYSTRVFANARLSHNEALRSGAVRLIVALLPRTFPVLERLLSDFSTSLWYEVHFTAFSALDRKDLSAADQERILKLIDRYLTSVKSESGFAAWKAGDMLGDEWYSPETARLLANLVQSARYVAGRKGALHGIAHAIEKAKRPEREHLLALAQTVASGDCSESVREYASWVLKNGGCLH